MEKIQITIIGGGTAGWLTAAFLHTQAHRTLNRPVEITVIEASDIPTVGVGEATIPSLRTTLAACGIPEHVFMKTCDVTFKHGIEFINWKQSPKENQDDSYFHPFGEPMQVAGHNPAWQWAQLPVETRGAYADLFSVQPEIAKSGRAPKHVKDRPYDGALAYAYHLDAGKLAQFLKERFRKLGVHQIIDKVTHVERAGDDITALHLESGDIKTADIFIDCTGFAARLINSDKQNPFESKSHVLFVDKAVTVRVPHKGGSDIKGYTKCTAQEAGWIWDIALQGRRGIGHVYSTRHIDDDAAKAQLVRYIGQSEDELEIRHLNMRIGYHQQQWRGNCIAVGLSSGFLEPLESTGIYLIEMANWAMLEMLPRYLGGTQDMARRQYNKILAHHYENITDFLKLHYCLSQRDDSQFWRDNRDPKTIPATLQTRLDTWENAVPSVYDFNSTTQCFSANNYQFVLYGMGWSGHSHELGKPSSQFDAMIGELAKRREKMKQFVMRDTISNADFFTALSKI